MGWGLGGGVGVGVGKGEGGAHTHQRVIRSSIYLDSELNRAKADFLLINPVSMSRSLRLSRGNIYFLSFSCHGGRKAPVDISGKRPQEGGLRARQVEKATDAGTHSAGVQSHIRVHHFYKPPFTLSAGTIKME